MIELSDVIPAVLKTYKKEQRVFINIRPNDNKVYVNREGSSILKDSQFIKSVTKLMGLFTNEELVESAKTLARCSFGNLAKDFEDRDFFIDIEDGICNDELTKISWFIQLCSLSFAYDFCIADIDFSESISDIENPHIKVTIVSNQSKNQFDVVYDIDEDEGECEECGYLECECCADCECADCECYDDDDFDDDDDDDEE
jgi:hypothetical protein